MDVVVLKKYLLPKDGSFYKANLHCHSTFSDGKKTPEELKELYKKLGYSILAYTDHDVLIPHDELNDDEFLALHGFEMEINEPKPNEPFEKIKTCHMCFIGIEPDNILQPCWHRSRYQFGNAVNYRHLVKFDDTLPDFVRSYDSDCVSTIMQTASEKGFFVTYNHPAWSLERYPDYINYKGMHAMEIFNGECLTNGHDDYNPRVYEDFLSVGNKLFCIGADDNHNFAPDDSVYSSSGKAFTMIKADSLDYRTVTKALENGNFYASEGPEIYELWYEDGRVHVKCSEVEKIICNYAVRTTGRVFSENGTPVTEATFGIRENLGWFRITLIDKAGKRACTNAYFVDELL